MPLSRCAPFAVALVALVHLAACTHGGSSYVAVTPRGDADSCATVRERVRASGFVLADVPPVESPRNMQPPELAPEDDAGKTVPGFMLTYLIDASGAVDPSTVRTTGRVSPRLESAMRRAVRGWRFTPARYHGCAVAHEARDTFTFTPPPK